MKITWVHSFSPKASNSGVFMHSQASVLSDMGCELDLVYTGRLRTVSSFRRAYRLVREKSRGSDLVHAQYGSGCGWLVSRIPGPKVLTLRGSDWYRGGRGSLAGLLHGAAAHVLTTRALARYDLTIAVSEKIKKEIRRKGFDVAVEVMPSGVDLELFQPAPKETAREGLGVGTDVSPWVLFASALEDNPTKRPGLALDSVARARKLIPNLKLRVLSGVPHRMVPQHINASDLVLLTSTHEGWPNIIKESLACNVPFVATDVSDLHLVAAQERSCHISTADPGILAKNIVEVLGCSRPKNLRRYVEVMGQETTARRLLRVYDQVLERWRASQPLSRAR